MDDSNDLLYSEEASATRALFYQGLNDINLFVEDKGMEYLYETIFKRLLGANYCISAIYALGGKTNVIARYHEFGDKLDDTPNFYIVDGDFDRYIHKEDMVNAPNFIYLQSYNIENYFPKIEFDKNIKSLICIGTHADRRGVQKQAREKGLKIIYIDPEGFEIGNGFEEYLIEGASDNDLIFRVSANSFANLIDINNIKIK